MRKGLLWASLVLITLAGCAPAVEEPEVVEVDDQLWERASMRFFPLPTAIETPDNPLTPAKVELGKTLYFDKRLSRNSTISCDSCHSLATFGVDNLSLSPGDTGEFGGRNSPTVLNAALHVAQFWDGRAESVEEQAGMPILNPLEMGIPSEQFLVDRLASIEGYPELFADAFPDETEPLTYANVGKALAAFERTLLTPSRFDDYLAGNREALDPAEKAGLDTFMTLGCSACHNGFGIGGASFRKFGLHEDYWVHTKGGEPDVGRLAVTGAEDDRYVFKVASLRNVAETTPYFHDGSVATLEEAVRIMARAQLGRDLSDEEAAGLTAFLGSLSGEVPEAARSAAASL